MPQPFKFPDEVEQENDLENTHEEDNLDEDIPQDTAQGEGDDTEDVEVEIVDDTPEEDRNRGPRVEGIQDPTEEELESYNEKVQRRLREMTRARHDERRRADALEREKAELERVARLLMEREQELRRHVTMGQTAYIEQAKQAAQFALETAKNELRQAYDAGDSEAIASAQERLTNAQLQLQRANDFRAQPLQTEQQPAYTPQQQVAHAPAQPQIDDRTIDWHSRNPWFQRQGDEDMTGYALGVHAKLVREYGEDFPGSPEYFKMIDSAMRKAFPERLGDESGSGGKAPAAKRPSPVVAPAQRATRAKKVRLTKSQVNIANRLGISLEGYAKQLAALEKNNG